MMSFIENIKKIVLACCVLVFSVCEAEKDRVVVNINEGIMKPINIALHLHDGASVKDRFLSSASTSPPW